MNEEMVKVVDWLQINRLSLNLNKTHFILFQRKRIRVSMSVDVIIDNVKIDMVEGTKFLGVIIDQNLSFQGHINYIKGKVARGIGILYKSQAYFSFETMRVLYNAFIFPYFTYCIEVWGNTYKSYLEPLVKLQKHAIRTIVGARKCAHTALLFINLKLLNTKEIYIYCVQLFMYKYHHNILPSIFSDFFVRNNTVHEYDTSQQNLFHVPLIFTKPLSRTVRVSGVTLYYHFNNVLCLRVSYVTYKGILKRHIIDNNIMNLLWTLWVDMPWYWSHNYLCCIGEVSPYSYDQCKWFDVRLLHLQCINNGNECVALNGWACSLGFGEDCWHPFGGTAGARAQSRVTNTSHRTPAMAGPSDGWLALGCAWVYCSPHVSEHYCYVNVIVIRNIILIVIVLHGYLALNHWTVCWKLVLHWARYECTCCTALTLVVEIVIIYCMPSLT